MSSKKQEVFSPFDRSNGRNSGIDIELSSGPSTGQHSGKFSTTQSEKSIDTNTVPTCLIGGESTVFGASFNFVNSIVGAGIIAIPLAIQECGLVLGILLLIIVAFLIYRSVLMLIECGMRTEQYDLEELAEHLLGSRGYYCSLIFMFLFAYGAQIAYLIIIGDTVPRAAELLFPGTFLTNRTATLILSATIVVLPLCLFRSLSTLSWTSLLSILADVIIVIIVLAVCSTITTNQDEHFQERDTGNVENSMFEGVGTMSFAFVCQHNSFIIFRSLKQPTLKNWTYVAGQSVSFACAICIMFGLVGFFTFYPYVEGDLLNNFSVNNPSIATARLLLAITMVFTYPMECYVTRHCIITAMSRLGYSKYLGGESRPGMLSTFWTALTDRVDRVLAEWCGSDPHAHRHHNHRRPSMDPSSDHALAQSRSVSISSSTTGGGISKNTLEETKNQRKKSTHTVNSPKGGVLPVSTLSRSSSGGSNTIATPNPDASHSEGEELTESVTEENGLYATSLSVHVTLTLGIWASTLGIALATTDLGIVAALTGAVAASMLGFILPALIYLKAHEAQLHCTYVRSLEILSVLRNGPLAETTTSSSSSAAVGVTREARAASQEELTAECREHALQSAIRLYNSPLQDVEFGNNADNNMYHEDDRLPLHPKRRTTTFSLIQELFSIYSKFYVPFLMVAFGCVALVVGVVTVFTSSA